MRSIKLTVRSCDNEVTSRSESVDEGTVPMTMGEGVFVYFFTGLLTSYLYCANITHPSPNINVMSHSVPGSHALVPTGKVGYFQRQNEDVGNF